MNPPGKRTWLVAFGTTMITTGCSGRDEALFSLGGFLFTIFLLVLSMTYLVKHLHANESIRELISKLKTPALLLSLVLFVLSAAALSAGSLMLLSEDFGPEKLTFFLGVMLFLLAYYIRRWALSPMEEKGHFARLASISIGFSLAMLYIILGAKAIRLE
ncbi:hypothetical protein G3480_03675 [Thiorhodococcus mannitoliphagus]|uniref:Uncharacterized protein n=1 Tax=Thiorhodococcus mannitoliphagus TaxID=329406 RepID=A0A6P1DTQ5_9GAMM|nr:hypothetical protein [Thiorhodococcus mannitoliphagus]NEX19422.1 hypothetical protein [Thiorhodococcus mannitoliphagus]